MCVKVTWVKTFLSRNGGRVTGGERRTGMLRGGGGVIKQLPTFHSTNIESKRGDTCGRGALNLLTHPFLNRVGSAPLITNFDKSRPADRGGSPAGRYGPVQLTRRHANNLGQQEGVDCSESKIDLPICTTMFTPCSLACLFFTALDFTALAQTCGLEKDLFIWVTLHCVHIEGDN